MKLHWIPATTVSLLRMNQRIGRDRELKDTELTAALHQPVRDIQQRLISASLLPEEFWGHLIDEVVSGDQDPPLTPSLCEIALLRAGHSQLQSDQTATVVSRELEGCRSAVLARMPRFADQLRLRYAPLQQAYQAYGPGTIRLLGKEIWNGNPPRDWWPARVAVHAVQPLSGGAAGTSSYQASVWIEAVLTDASPNIPEWLRLVYQLACLAISTQTRTHSSGLSSTEGQSDAPPTELPWTLALVPMVLAQAKEIGLITESDLPIHEAIELWIPMSPQGSWTPPRAVASALNRVRTAEVLSDWWNEAKQSKQATPVALKQLASALHQSSQAENC